MYIGKYTPDTDPKGMVFVVFQQSRYRSGGFLLFKNMNQLENLSFNGSKNQLTPWKFNIAPEKWWLEYYFPIGKVALQSLC